MSLDYSDIGKRIRYLRTSKQISQEELAEAAELSVTHISHIETGNTKLSLPTIVKIPMLYLYRWMKSFVTASTSQKRFMRMKCRLICRIAL